MHFYSWKNGLKTGMYYLRSRPAADAIKFTLNVEELLKATDGNDTDSVLKCLNAQKQTEEPEKNLEKRSSSGLMSIKSIKSFDEPEACINCSG